MFLDKSIQPAYHLLMTNIIFYNETKNNNKNRQKRLIIFLGSETDDKNLPDSCVSIFFVFILLYRCV